MNKVVRLGTKRTHGGRWYSVFCAIKISEDGRLSITGVDGPTPDGNCLGGCGQIGLGARDIVNLAPGWSRAKLRRFFEVWNCWHLNDMRAGTPAQTAWLRDHAAEFPGYPVSHYEWARGRLAEAGLNPDNGYSYGSKWLREDVPADVVEFLASLPDTDRQPAWV